MNWKIWICVPVVYGLFSLWYFNWQGPLTQAEVEHFMATFPKQEGSSHTDGTPGFWSRTMAKNSSC